MWERSVQWSEDSGIGILTRPWATRPCNCGSIPDTDSKFFLSTKLSQISCENHSASYIFGAGGCFPTYKDAGMWNWTIYLPQVLGFGVTRAVPPLSHRFHGVLMDTFRRTNNFYSPHFCSSKKPLINGNCNLQALCVTFRIGLPDYLNNFQFLSPYFWKVTDLLNVLLTVHHSISV
jgi:hypothetical protein